MDVCLRWRTILVRFLVYAAAQLCARKSGHGGVRVERIDPASDSHVGMVASRQSRQAPGISKGGTLQ